MSKLDEEFYAILVPKRANYGPVRSETGTRDWDSFRVDRIVRTRPTTKTNEVAVRLKLSVDSSIFDKLIPVVEIELGERELFVNTAVEINGAAVSDEGGTD
jgi:hypothetical protein